MKIRQIFEIDISRSCGIYNKYNLLEKGGGELFETKSSLQISYLPDDHVYHAADIAGDNAIYYEQVTL